MCSWCRERGGRSTPATDFTTPQMYPRGALSSKCLDGRNSYPHAQWNQNPSLCVSPVCQLCAPYRNSPSLLASKAFPTHTSSYFDRHTPSASGPLSPPAPSPGAPGLRCGGWVAQLCLHTASVKIQSPTHALSRAASAKASCVSVSSSLKWE